MKLLLENWREYIKEQEEVNEIFGKKKKIVDLDKDDVRRIDAHSRYAKELIRDAVRAHSYWSQDDSGNRARWLTTLRVALGDLINKYEKEIEPDISRLMIAKSNLEKETHQLDKNLIFMTTPYLKVDHEIEPLPYVEELLSRLIGLRNQILGAYRKHRTVAGMSKYEPKPGMYDLEKLMGQAMVREEGIMDFFRGKEEVALTLDTLQRIYGDYRDYMRHYYRTSGKKNIRDLKSNKAKKRRMEEIEDLIPHIQSNLMVLQKATEQVESGKYKWPSDFSGKRRSGIKDWNLLPYPEKFLAKLTQRMEVAERNLMKLHGRYAHGLGFDKYTGDVEADYESIKDFMDTAKER